MQVVEGQDHQATSKMQQPITACTRAQPLTTPYSTCIWLPPPPPTSSQDGLDPLQRALWLCFHAIT